MPTTPATQHLDQSARLTRLLPHDPHPQRSDDHDQARTLLPGWAVEIRESTFPRIRGWWQCALDRAANHGGRPLLIYRIGSAPLKIVIAIRDLSPETATAPPNLSVEMDLQAFAAIVNSTRRLKEARTRPPRGVGPVRQQNA